jgi:hypothetical protein
MRPASELLADLSQKAKQAEAYAAEVRTRNRAKLEARRNEIEESLEESGPELDIAQTGAAANWQQVRNNLRAGFQEKKASIKAEIDAQKAARDAKRATKRADQAEAEADVAVKIAVDAFEQAEYTVLDAVIARAEADELNAS